MAARYSGNVEMRISLHRMRGWNGKMGWFYKTKVSLPGHHGVAILSPREVGIEGAALKNLRSSENFDAVARAVLSFADDETGGLIKDEALREKGDWFILRVQQSPCPLTSDKKRWRP